LLDFVDFVDFNDFEDFSDFIDFIDFIEDRFFSDFSPDWWNKLAIVAVEARLLEISCVLFGGVGTSSRAGSNRSGSGTG
jgi:hypothetical protein